MAKKRSGPPGNGPVRESFKAKAFSPLYLLYGEEEFLLEQTLTELLDEALDPSTRSFNLDVVPGPSTDVRELVALASAFPMMAERRVVLVREFDRLAEKELLLPYIENPLSSTILVVVTEKPDYRQKIFKALERSAVVLEFKRLYENDIPGWIEERVRGMGKKTTPEACQLLQAHVGRSLRELQNEIDKLFIYVGERGTIGIDDVSSVVGVSRQYNIFELQRAVGQKNLKRSIEIVERMLEMGESPIGMIVMLTRYFEKVWRVQELRQQGTADGQIASAIGVSPFFVREFAEASQRFSVGEVEGCFAALLEADEALKTSKGQPQVVMTLLVYRLIAKPAVEGQTPSRAEENAEFERFA